MPSYYTSSRTSSPVRASFGGPRSSSPTKPRPNLSAIPTPGEIVWFPFDNSVPASSVINEQRGPSFGQPWGHPCLVRSIDRQAMTVTVFQVTSIDLVERSKNWMWAQRYVPIAHSSDKPGKARHPNEHQDHPSRMMPLLQLKDNGDMRHASNVNVETILTIEWRYLHPVSYGGAGRQLHLTDESFAAVMTKEEHYAELKRHKSDTMRPLFSRSPSPPSSSSPGKRGLATSSSASTSSSILSAITPAFQPQSEGTRTGEHLQAWRSSRQENQRPSSSSSSLSSQRYTIPQRKAEVSWRKAQPTH